MNLLKRIDSVLIGILLRPSIVPLSTSRAKLVVKISIPEKKVIIHNMIDIIWGVGTDILLQLKLTTSTELVANVIIDNNS